MDRSLLQYKHSIYNLCSGWDKAKCHHSGPPPMKTIVNMFIIIIQRRRRRIVSRSMLKDLKTIVTIFIKITTIGIRLTSSPRSSSGQRWKTQTRVSPWWQSFLSGVVLYFHVIISFCIYNVNVSYFNVIISHRIQCKLHEKILHVPFFHSVSMKQCTAIVRLLICKPGRRTNK